MKICFQVTLFFFALTALTSCQKPASLAMSQPTASIMAQPTFRDSLPVGLEQPTWEFTKQQMVKQIVRPPKQIDDTYYRIKTSQKVIAITFDDGPHRTNTPRLLDMLKQRNVKATFFVVGNMVRYNPQMLRRMIDEGHEIGNHTVSHPNLARMSQAALTKELETANKQIIAATGVAPRCMRPPGGAITKAQKQFMLQKFGFPTIMWSCDPKDWKKPGVSVVAQRLIDGATPGGILLVHDLHKPTIDAMPRTLDTLLAQGYRFVTISELIAMDEG